MLSVKFPAFEVLGAPRAQSDPAGLFVKAGGLKGFEGLPAGRRQAIERPMAHGEFDVPVFRGPRILTIEGVAVAQSGFDLAGLRALVTGCGAAGEQIKVSYELQGTSTYFTARVLETVFTDRGHHGRRLIADFTINMVCADPRKYGAGERFAGASVTVFQYGNFPATPVVEVAGPRSGPYTITGPGGRAVTVAQSLAAAQTHRIDFASGTVTRNGARQLGALTHFTPWTIPPGSQVPMSISAGSMTVTVTDTYM